MPIPDERLPDLDESDDDAMTASPRSDLLDEDDELEFESAEADEAGDEILEPDENGEEILEPEDARDTAGFGFGDPAD